MKPVSPDAVDGLMIAAQGLHEHPHPLPLKHTVGRPVIFNSMKGKG